MHPMVAELATKMNAEVQVDCPVQHHFDDGVYVREVTMPKGSIILGKRHKHSCINIVSKGACVLVDLETGELSDIQAPYTFVSKPGVQKLAYIVEECVWSNVHVTETTDLNELEEELIVKEDIKWLG